MSDIVSTSAASDTTRAADASADSAATDTTSGAVAIDSDVFAPEAEHDRNREAFESTAPERDAPDEKDVAMPNLDVVSSISIASAAMPAILNLAPQIKALPLRDKERIDRLQAYIWALLFAQLAHAASVRTPEVVSEMAARGAKKRELFIADISPLIKRGVIDAKQLDQLRGGVSHRNIALDLQLLVFIARQHWDVIASRTMITEDELNEAQLLGQELFDSTSDRQRTTPRVLKAASDRSRAFMLLVSTYDEVRRAVAFLRWHEGDADTLVPSLYGGRTSRSSKSEAGGKDAPTPVAPVAGGAPVAPVAGGAPVGGGVPVSPVAGGAQPVAPVIPGQPGGSPFLR